MNKTNTGLVAYAKKALAEKWGYVWGTFGKLLTAEALAKKIQQYPDMVGTYQGIIRSKWLGRKTSDCVGLIKSYIWFDGSDVSYDGKYDISADGMYAKAKEKGTLPTIPDVPGVCVWKPGHIGVYIGGGQVIEAHNTSHGVIQTPLRGKGATPWTHWLKCPFITYEQAEPKHVNNLAAVQALCNTLKLKDASGKALVVNGKPSKATSEAITKLPTLKQGSQGPAVVFVQKRLGATADGIYGPMTEAVVRAFQVRCSFLPNEVTGMVGAKTWTELTK